MSKVVVRETVVLLERQINAGLANGESLVQIRKRIMNSFKGMRKYRAERIARSEVVTASNQATLEAWKQSGVVTKKIWYTALDERVCPTCSSLHGQAISLEKHFIKKGGSILGTDDKRVTYDYRDIGEPALHPNCRCTMVPEVSAKSVKEKETVSMEELVKKTVDEKQKLEDESIEEMRKQVKDAIEEYKAT